MNNAPTATRLRDEDGVLWKPSPIVAVAAITLLATAFPSVWPPAHC